MNATRPLRILQVVGNLNRGGTETWLMNVLRQLDRERFRMDFLVHSTNPGAYEAEARELGAGIVTCLHPGRPHRYAANFLREVRSHGPYDFVHSHMHHYSGFVLKLARRAGIGGRIAHSHSDTSRIEQEDGPARKLYYTLARRWIRRNATLGLAASGAAAAALFGADWKARRRCEVVHCGIDLSPFQAPVDHYAVRAELGVPRDAFVIGHVGRFVAVKNHGFLLDVAGELARTDAHVHVVLAGDGPLRPALEARVAHSPLAGRVHFVGARSDVPRLLAALDVFVFPSQYEGLGLAVDRGPGRCPALRHLGCHTGRSRRHPPADPPRGACPARLGLGRSHPAVSHRRRRLEPGGFGARAESHGIRYPVEREEHRGSLPRRAGPDGTRGSERSMTMVILALLGISHALAASSLLAEGPRRPDAGDRGFRNAFGHPLLRPRSGVEMVVSAGRQRVFHSADRSR